MRLKLVFLITLPLICAQTQLLDYGERAGDQRLEFSAGQHATTMDVPVVYMEVPYSDIYISPNGIVGFGERLPDGVTPLQRLNRSAIAPFYAPASDGTVYYRSTSSDQRLLRRLTDYIHKTFADSMDFQTLQATIVTWDGIQNKENDGRATFQLALASDGMISYALIQFLALPWSASAGTYAQSGFAMPDGRYQSNTNSGGPDVKELVGLSNNPEGTSFIFRISGSVIEDPRENPDDYEYTNYDQTDYDGDDKKPPAQCPVDPYNDRCPEGCNILTDERMCSRCVCAEPQPDNAEGMTDDATHEKLPEPPHLARHNLIENRGPTNAVHTQEKTENSGDTRNEEEERRQEKERRLQQETQRERERLRQKIDERRREYDRHQIQRQQEERHKNQEEKMLQGSMHEGGQEQCKCLC
ncbi:hypothetical protein Y032_0342g3047 [Ancylostoma ceylanicum]|uniref:NIDO domain-containing protein n=1 Tax=Ancylostoma ceylanicum TaxID=53326 RepID=A0A016RXN9_9BILA|nr:hypothetical protein Y032_0342g3047 [Ancylostoma ceylanicum]